MNAPCPLPPLAGGALIDDEAWPTGVQVALVGAGPGDAGLLTLRARARLRAAEVVLYDHLINPAILALAAQARLCCVGKRAGAHSVGQRQIEQLLIDEARAGRRVVRLKGGDPLLFGRGGEEMQALAAAGLRYEVTPGVSAALGAAAMAHLPLTHRDHAQGCTLVTGHRRDDASELAWTAHTHPGATVVVYMGVRQAGAIAQALMQHGRAADTPAARASALGHHMGSSPSTRTRSSSDHAVALRFMRKLILPFFPIGTGRTKFSTIFFNNDRFCGA